MEEWNGVKSKKKKKNPPGLTWNILLCNVCWFFFYLSMDALVIFGIFCWKAWARWKHITVSESDETFLPWLNGILYADVYKCLMKKNVNDMQ